MTLRDLQGYTVRTKKALKIKYRGYNVFSTEVPSSGAVTLSILNTMQQYPQADAIDDELTSHRFVEAMKFAYGARQKLGDPNYVVNIKDLQQELLSDERAKRIRASILDNQTQPLDAYMREDKYTTDSAGTSHLVTADGYGMTVSSTTTINLGFGSHVMTPDTGIIL